MAVWSRCATYRCLSRLARYIRREPIGPANAKSKSVPSMVFRRSTVFMIGFLSAGHWCAAPSPSLILTATGFGYCARNICHPSHPDAITSTLCLRRPTRLVHPGSRPIPAGPKVIASPSAELWS